MASNADKPPDDWYNNEHEIKTDNKRRSRGFKNIGPKLLEDRKNQVEKQLRDKSPRKTSLANMVETVFHSKSDQPNKTLPRNFNASRCSSKNECEIKPPENS